MRKVSIDFYSYYLNKNGNTYISDSILSLSAANDLFNAHKYKQSLHIVNQQLARIQPFSKIKSFLPIKSMFYFLKAKIKVQYGEITYSLELLNKSLQIDSSNYQSLELFMQIQVHYQRPQTLKEKIKRYNYYFSDPKWNALKIFVERTWCPQKIDRISKQIKINQASYYKYHRPYFFLATIKFSCNHYQQIIQYYQQDLQFEIDNIFTIDCLIMFSFIMEDYSKFEKYLQMKRVYWPLSINDRILEAACCIQKGEKASARRIFQKIQHLVEVKKQQIPRQYYLCYIGLFYHFQMYERAIVELKRLKVYKYCDREKMQAGLILMHCYEKLGRPQEQRKALMSIPKFQYNKYSVHYTQRARQLIYIIEYSFENGQLSLGRYYVAIFWQMIRRLNIQHWTQTEQLTERLKLKKKDHQILFIFFQ